MVRLSAYDAGRRLVLGSYKSSAASRHLAWDLTDDDAVLLLVSCCTFCGEAPQREIRPAWRTDPDEILFTCNGIDRIDNRAGYLSHNVQPACWDCNRIKGQLTTHELCVKIRKIYQHLRLNDHPTL